MATRSFDLCHLFLNLILSLETVYIDTQWEICIHMFCFHCILGVYHQLLTHWGQDKMADISQTTFSKDFLEWKCKISIMISFWGASPVLNVSQNIYGCSVSGMIRKMINEINQNLTRRNHSTTPQRAHMIRDDVMKWRCFTHYQYLWGESIGGLGISLKSSQWVELWCFLCCYPDKAVGRIIKMPVIWGVISTCDTRVVSCWVSKLNVRR